MKFHEILRSVTWTRLKKKIHELYPEREAMLPGYKAAFDVLRKTAPAASARFLYFERERWDGVWATVVYSLDETGVCGYLPFTPWREVLGMDVMTGPKFVSRVEMVVELLYEITFWGFSEEQIAVRLERLQGK